MLNAIERLPGALQRGDGVLESRRRRVVRDPVDLGEVLGHAGFERGLELRTCTRSNGGTPP